ncbi:MAG: ribosome biogenesis GTP-binding protein YihA/YsxC, partial [Ignavibacteriaceae bacterium]
GRSNVGKSSFINSLFNRKDLAKTSSTPGKTRSINYYLIDNKFYIVDLPGYGYAKTSKKEREYWGKLIGDFITKPKKVSLAFHFIDSRHDPSELDIHLNQILNQFEIPYIVVLNKIDKLSQSQFSKSKKNIVEFFPELSFGDNLLIYSSVKKTGKQEFQKRLHKLFY